IDIRHVSSSAERVSVVRNAFGGQGADLCIEVEGVLGVVQEGLEMLRTGARYLWMGNIVPGAETRIIPHDATRQPKMILGVLAYHRWVIPRALDWLVRAQHRYPLER